MNRSIIALITVTAVWFSVEVCFAQRTDGFSLDRYVMQPSVEDGHLVQLPQGPLRNQLMGRFAIGYQQDPLILATDNDFRTAVPVEKRLSLYASLAYGISDRFGVFVQIPLSLFQDGSVDSLDSFAVGDLILGAQGIFFGEAEGFSIGGSIGLIEPTGDRDAFSGAGDLGGLATIRLAYRKRLWEIAGHLGANFAPTRTVFAYTTGTDMYVALGAFVKPVRWLRLGAELTGTTGITKDRFFTTSNSHLEIGGSVFFYPSARWMIGVSGTTGVQTGVGTPQFRTLITGGFTVGPSS